MRGVAEADAHPELTEGKEDAGHRGHTPDGESVLKLLSPVLPAHGLLGPSGSEGWLGPAPAQPGPAGVSTCGHSLGDTSFCRWEYSFRKKVVISFSAEEKLFRVGEAGSFLG